MVADKELLFIMIAILLLFESEVDLAHGSGVGESLGEGDKGARVSGTADIGKSKGICISVVVAEVRLEWGTCCTGLGPFGSATTRVEVDQSPVGEGVLKAAGVGRIRSTSGHDLVHGKSEGFATVGDSFPTALLGNHLSDNGGEVSIGG